jgi:hypothetical protein
MNHRLSKAIRGTCIVILAMVTSRAAMAQLKPCKASVPPAPYKVFVDGMRVGPSLVDTDEIKNLKARIGVAVENDLAELKLQLMDTELKQQKTLPEIRVIPCDGLRFPGDLSDFTSKEMTGLSDSRVLLELWGRILSSKDGTAHLGYVLTPAYKVQLPAVFSIRQSIGKATTSPEQLFHENKMFKGYAELVVGIQFYRNDDFDAAAGYLCSGALKLETTLKSRPAPITPEEKLFERQQQQLIDGVRAIGADAIRRAAQSSSSSISAVSVGPAACPAKEE